MWDSLPAIAKRATATLIQQQAFFPLVQLEYKGGMCIITFPTDKFEANKAGALTFVQIVAGLLNADAVTFMAEVWLRAGQNLDPNVRPSEAEDRKEGIFLLREEEGGEQSVMFLEIERDERGRIIGTRELPSERNAEVRGRLTGWLPDKTIRDAAKEVYPTVDAAREAFEMIYGWRPQVIFVSIPEPVRKRMLN